MHLLDVPWTIINFVPFVILIDKIELALECVHVYVYYVHLKCSTHWLMLPPAPPPPPSSRPLALVMHSWCIHWCIFNVLLTLYVIHIRFHGFQTQITAFFCFAMNMNRKWKKPHRHTFTEQMRLNTVAIAVCLTMFCPCSLYFFVVRTNFMCCFFRRATAAQNELSVLKMFSFYGCNWLAIWIL